MTIIANYTPEPSWLLPTIITTGLLLFTALIFGLLAFSRWYLTIADLRLARCFRDIPDHTIPAPGHAAFRFPVYVGFLGGGTETVYHVHLPPSEATTLLKRLHRFNCSWGCLMLGPLAPLISTVNYLGALRKIRR